MKLQVIVPVAVLLSLCSAAPILQPRIGIIASNSNEILRLNGITLAGMGMGMGVGQAQGTPLFSPFLIQPQADILLPPQILNFGAQVPFLPPQQNQLPQVLIPPNPQEQPTALNPNNPQLNQNPGQMVPQFLPFPQGTGGQQGFPYYLTYGFNGGNPQLGFPPNQKTALQNPVRPTLGPRPPVQNNGNMLEPWRLTPPPDNRGDRPGVDGDPALSFFKP